MFSRRSWTTPYTPMAIVLSPVFTETPSHHMLSIPFPFFPFTRNSYTVSGFRGYTTQRFPFFLLHG